MKTLIASLPIALLIAAAPALVAAQPAAAKPAAAKPAAKTPAKKTPKGSHSAQKSTEEATPIDDDPAVKLSEADLEVAKKVYTGDIPCELGATVHITPHKREGFFIVRSGLQRFRMHPVESRTGAIRLEDPVAGAMWLQLGNKSMLMSQKFGKRLADDCMNPAQTAVNDALKINPIPSLLEPLPAAKAASAATAAVPPSAAPTVAAPAPAAATSVAAPAPAASAAAPAEMPAAAAPGGAAK